MSKRNPFIEWIKEEGIDSVSKKLKTGRSTVINWLTGRANPRVVQMREIKRITKGAITYDDMIEREPFRSPNSRYTVKG